MAETFPLIVAHLRAGVYTCAAGGTVLLYDIIITSEDEIRLIWASSFSLVKCLYFVVSHPRRQLHGRPHPCLESLSFCPMFNFGNVPYVYLHLCNLSLY
jgi:Family of unknown function (DUF6533)